MVKGLVSVVIPVYKGEKYILATVESVLVQSYPQVEILVVDDGSPNAAETEQVLKGVMDRIRFFRKDNGGPASARNFGIRQAQGEFIAFLDGDDIWEQDKLQTQMACFDHPDVGLVFSDVSLIDSEGSAFDNKISYQKHQGRVFHALFGKNFIPTSTVVVRSASLEKSGLFNESSDVFSVEDYDLWLRIAAHDEFRHVPRALVKYRKHVQGISFNIEKSYAAEKAVIDGIVRDFSGMFPELTHLYRRRMAFLFFEKGISYLYAGQFSQSRSSFRESLKCDPVFVKSMVFWMWSFVKQASAAFKSGRPS